MRGKKSGVSTQILAEQPKAVAIHRQEHSLSLSVKSVTKECDILHDVMSVVGEICILVKFSPKREHLLGKITDNIKKEDSKPFKKLKKLSATRWTVRAECMKRIIDNYESLLHCGKSIWKKSWTKKQTQGLCVARAKWNLFIFFRHQSIVQALCNDR